MMSMRLLLPLLALVLSPLVISASKEKTWTLYHGWKGHDFTKRGKVALKLQDGLPTITIDNTQEMKGLPLDDFYQLKLVEDGHKDIYTLTSVPACQVYRANFRDEFTITFNHRKSVISMAYEPLVSPLAPSCDDLQPATDAKEFTSKISLETATPGMVLPAVLPQNKPPVGLKFLKSKNGSGSPALEGTEEEATAQSFLRKYWYIILPLFIMSMTSGGGGGEQEAPHPSQQQQQGGGGQAAVAPVAAASTSSQTGTSSGSGGQPRRRGKRG